MQTLGGSKACGTPPLPWGEGGGEGVCAIDVALRRFIDSPHPLTLSLSPWERGPEALAVCAAGAFILATRQ
jgi:hypothetical protein